MISLFVFVLLVGGIVYLDFHFEKRRSRRFKESIKKQHEDIERLRTLVSQVSGLLAQKTKLRGNGRPNIISLTSSVKMEAQNIFINVYNPEVLTPEQLTALSGLSAPKSIREGRSSRRVFNYQGAEAFDFAELAKGLLGRSK